MTIADRLAAIQDRLATACAHAGRDPSEVRLLTASKTRSPEAVVEAMAAGQVLFGENRAQEFRDKRGPVSTLAAAAGLPAPEWHFIGAVQRNKIRYLAGHVTLVHAIDKIATGTALSERVMRGDGPPQAILVEVNTGGEASKAGVPPHEALALAHALDALDGVRVQGLMTIPPPVANPSDSAPCFANLAALAAQGRDEGLDLRELSMGMSGDFEEAIRHGATIVRVGTAIFGPRG
jgi:PLP dependent protein